ncbi:MAG TPA: hypothetical protein HA283_05445 [Nanoarchaeota archaeon]|nr:hypothetical protein [Nanoarchaeota archaeon]HIH63712.1 hypothetical protein [Nanoarchaeota archaeon]HIJ09585.1 hypothetical protein [Nanoarchaeota archaeon]
MKFEVRSNGKSEVREFNGKNLADLFKQNSDLEGSIVFIMPDDSKTKTYEMINENSFESYNLQEGDKVRIIQY